MLIIKISFSFYTSLKFISKNKLLEQVVDKIKANNYTFCMICNICPRACNINRTKQKGFCGTKEKMIINKVMLHLYEEPIISVGKGSGAIFFSGCNLRCVFCQNFPISHSVRGRKVSQKGLVKIFKKLERMGAANINLVTPTHFTSQIIEALKMYKPSIPVVWNSNGYENAETIENLKYMDNGLALKYSGANNYVENATKTILKMKEIAPQDVVVNGVMQKGIIVRHLVLPTHTDDSIKCMQFIFDNLGANTIVSIMSQYEPRYDAYKYPEINRKLTPLEYKRVVNFAIEHNMKNCYTQELSSASSVYTPKFK